MILNLILFYLLKKWQSETPSMTRRKMRRKKKAPDKRYKIAVVTLKETLDISDIATPFQPSLNETTNIFHSREQFPFFYEESVLAEMSIS